MKTITLAAALSLAAGLSLAPAFAQTNTTTTPSQLPSGAPPTTGSAQGAQPPNATPGATSYSAAPGSTQQPDQVHTTNPSSDPNSTKAAK